MRLTQYLLISFQLSNLNSNTTENDFKITHLAKCLFNPLGSWCCTLRCIQNDSANNSVPKGRCGAIHSLIVIVKQLYEKIDFTDSNERKIGQTFWTNVVSRFCRNCKLFERKMHFFYSVHFRRLGSSVLK